MSRLLLVVALGLCLPMSTAAQDVVEYYGTDAIGSVRIVFDANGNIVGRMDYGPFGEQVLVSAVAHKTYAGLFRDGEAGLDYAEARSFQVRTGRFNAPDPVYAGLFAPQAWNRYAYGLNAPVQYSDPEGLNADSGLRFTESVHVTADTGWVTMNPMLAFFLGWGSGGGSAAYQEPSGGRGRSPGKTTENPGKTSEPTIEKPKPGEPKGGEEECQAVPHAPPAVTIDVMISLARDISDYFDKSGRQIAKLETFYKMVRNKGPWDFKQFEPKGEYLTFGNFNFGATGSAMGYSQTFLLRGAGWAQGQSGNKGAGTWWGSYPYGDAHEDSLAIRRGVTYYQQKYVTQVCK